VSRAIDRTAARPVDVFCGPSRYILTQVTISVSLKIDDKNL